MLVLAVLWVLLVFAGAFRFRSIGPAGRGHRAATDPVAGSCHRSVGRFVRVRLGRPDDDRADERLGQTLLFAGPLLLIGPVLAVVAGLAIWMRPVLMQHKTRKRTEQEIVSELPEVIDLLRLAVLAGSSLLLALELITRDPRGPVSAALAQAVGLNHAGVRLTDALETSTADLNESARSFVRAVVGSELYGSPLSGLLDRLGAEARADRRRQAQTAARKVPIRMLMPLVTCVLPAFVLLTLVPTLAGTLDSLQLG